MYDFQEEFRSFAETRFASEMSIDYPALPVQWDNMPFKQPASGKWVCFCIKTNPEKTITIGRNKVVRTTGFIQIDVIDHEENGQNDAKRLASYCAEIFGYRKFKGTTISVSFWEKQIGDAMVNKEFIRVAARIFFTYDGQRIQTGVQTIA
jgi:hypothetical protein